VCWTAAVSGCCLVIQQFRETSEYTVDLFERFTDLFGTRKCSLEEVQRGHHHHHTSTILRPFFWDHPGEPVPEENFWTLWCKQRLTEADTSTIRLGATLSRLTSAHLHHPPEEVQRE